MLNIRKWFWLVPVHLDKSLNFTLKTGALSREAASNREWVCSLSDRITYRETQDQESGVSGVSKPWKFQAETDMSESWRRFLGLEVKPRTGQYREMQSRVGQLLLWHPLSVLFSSRHKEAERMFASSLKKKKTTTSTNQPTKPPNQKPNPELFRIIKSHYCNTAQEPQSYFVLLALPLNVVIQGPLY